MNLMSSLVSINATEQCLSVGSQAIDAAGLMARLATPLMDGQSITFGVRPEDVSLRPNSAIMADVLNTEALGAETLLLLRLEGLQSTIRARVGRDERPEKGSRVGIAIDMDRVKLFDATSGHALPE